jgi:hypothetical protein
MRGLRKKIAVLFVAVLLVTMLPNAKVYAASSLKAPNVTVDTVETFYPKLSWKKVKGAESYTIYLKAPGTTSYTKVKTIKKTSYIDRNFTAYGTGALKYYVVAKKGSEKSKKSEVIKWKMPSLNSLTKLSSALLSAVLNNKANSITFTSTKYYDFDKLKEEIKAVGLSEGILAESFGYSITSYGSAYLYQIDFARDEFQKVIPAFTPEDVYNAALDLLSSMDFDDKYIYTGSMALLKYAELALMQHPEYGYGVWFVTYGNGSCSFSTEESGKDNLSERYELASQRADEILEEIITPDMTTDTEKMRAVHDYIVKNTIYDEGHTSDPSDPCYSAYGCLVEQSCVCMGYVASINMFAKKLGIPSIGVVDNGDSKGVFHSWNYLLLDGEYRYIDATWDDPVPDQGAWYVDHTYFAVSDNTIAAYHRPWDRELYSTKYVDLSIR